MAEETAKVETVTLVCPCCVELWELSLEAVREILLAVHLGTACGVTAGLTRE